MGEFELRTADFNKLLQVTPHTVDIVCPRDRSLNPPLHLPLPLNQVYYRLPPPAAPLAGEYLADTLECVGRIGHRSKCMKPCPCQVKSIAPTTRAHSCGAGANDMLASLGFGNPVLPGFWVGKGFVAGEGWGYNLFLDAKGQLTRK